MIFTGYYEHAIDEKNRLAIPAKMRSRLDPRRDGPCFVVVPGQPETSLWLYTERHFENLSARAESTLIPAEDQLRFDQVFFPMAEVLEPDAQGRIVLPERMVKRAGLGREVVLCGVRDHIEIRRQDEFKERLEGDWRQFREYQQGARAAYRSSMRQTDSERESGELDR